MRILSIMLLRQCHADANADADADADANADDDIADRQSRVDDVIRMMMTMMMQLAVHRDQTCARSPECRQRTIADADAAQNDDADLH